MYKGRILFVAEPERSPSGGIAALYRHAEVLSSHGLPAFVVLSRKPKIDFYRAKAPLLIHGALLSRRPDSLRRMAQVGDIWVIPEVYPRYLKAMKDAPGRHILFCQNHHYLKFSTSPGSGISEFGVDKIVVSTESIRVFFRDVYQEDVALIRSYKIDPALFTPGRKRMRQIAFMPRKLADDARFIAATFKRRHRCFADVPWVSIDNVAQHEAAQIMGESAVFLSLSHKDSLGLPPLEAMSCGCLVAGFHGEGGREYMTADNGWWADTGDWKTCIDGLAAALDLYDRGGPDLEARKRAMRETVDRYSPQRLEAEILDFWKKELGVDSSP